MKRMTILIAGLCLFLLGACSFDDNNFGTVETGSGTPEIGMTMPINNDEIRDILINLESISRLIIHGEWNNEQNRWINELRLIDVITGDMIASYEFGVEHQFSEPVDLGNGYFAVDVGIIDFATWETTGKKVIIFNGFLEVVDVVFYDTDKILALHLGFLQFVEGELIAYTLEAGDGTFGEILNPVRYNLHTGEIEVLAEINEFIPNMHQFVGDNQIFVSTLVELWDQGRIITRYGIVDLDIEETHFFEKEDFVYGHFDFRDAQVLMSESRSMGSPVISKVVVFNVEAMSSKSVALEGEESHWTYLSYDANYIVTINEEASLFRKYDFNGVVVAEIEIEIPLEVADSENYLNYPDAWFGNSFEIIPITEQIYAIFTTSTFGIPMWIEITEHSSQLVVLP